VGTEAGVFISSNSGNDWEELNTGLGSNVIWCFTMNHNGQLFAGSYDTGDIYRSVSPTTSVENEINVFPSMMFLYQNFPNPFNPITRIMYKVNSPEIITIKVYDILGKEIKTLLSEYKQAGVYELEFDASDLPSGVYFYRIISENYSETKKMMLLR
jgi:hypothetical protein